MPGIRTVRRHIIPEKDCEHCNKKFKPRSDYIRKGKGGRFCSRLCSQEWERLRKPNQSEKFWSYVNIGKPNECWLWNGYCNPDGYGMLRLDVKIQKCHRFSYEDKIGPIEKGLEILHKCDTPACCNPNHLRADTHDENMKDMARKKRSSAYKFHGEKHYKATLTDIQVSEIRNNFAIEKEPHKTIAKRYGVTSGIIQHILNNYTFKHLLVTNN